jgi:hypothetical protein
VARMLNTGWKRTEIMAFFKLSSLQSINFEAKFRPIGFWQTEENAVLAIKGWRRSNVLIHQGPNDLEILGRVDPDFSPKQVPLLNINVTGQLSEEKKQHLAEVFGPPRIEAREPIDVEFTEKE